MRIGTYIDTLELENEILRENKTKLNQEISNLEKKVSDLEIKMHDIQASENEKISELEEKANKSDNSKDFWLGKYCEESRKCDKIISLINNQKAFLDIEVNNVFEQIREIIL